MASSQQCVCHRIAINPAHTQTLVCAGAPLSSGQHSGVPQMRWKIVSMCSSSNLLRCPIWHPLSGRLRWKGMRSKRIHIHTQRPGRESGALRNSSNPGTITLLAFACVLALAARPITKCACIGVPNIHHDGA